MTLDVKLGRREEAEGEVQPAAQVQDPAVPQTGEMLGLTLQPVTPEMLADLGLQSGDGGLVVTKVDVAAEAYEKGLREGDVIMEAGQQKITSLKDLESRVAEAKEAGRKSILLLIRTQGDPRFVALTVK